MNTNIETNTSYSDAVTGSVYPLKYLSLTKEEFITKRDSFIELTYDGYFYVLINKITNNIHSIELNGRNNLKFYTTDLKTCIIARDAMDNRDNLQIVKVKIVTTDIIEG